VTATASDEEISGVGSVDETTLARIPRLIDLDAHVVEPPDLWSSRLPRRYQDAGPRVELLPNGHATMVEGAYVEAPGQDGPLVAWWRYEDHQASVKRTIAAAGFSADEVHLEGVTYDDIRPGCWQPEARLADMELNGVEMQMCFPNYPRFCGQQFLWGQDKSLAELCVRAYNDWMVEEWCGSSEGRLIPLCLIPLWDVDLAIAEVERNAARGVRAVAFSEIPAYLGLDSLYTRYWEPFFAACQACETVLCMHIGSGTKTPQTSADAPVAVGGTIIFGNTAASLADFIFSGVLHRHPGLRLLYAEAQVGWIPYVLERADDVWSTHRGWADSQVHCPEPPSTYYYRQVVSSFFKDRVGVELIDRVGAGNVVFETDYPHQDGTWPRSRHAAAQQFGELDQDLINRIARGNAIDLLSLRPPSANQAPA
jgi:predicted TIM-barrel fold metal-dependent hydrolase